MEVFIKYAKVLVRLILLSVIVASGSALANPSDSLFDSRPNIIHIIADDVAWDDITYFGSPDIKTPNLDRLALSGRIFTDFYAPHGTCPPSRAAILTGRYAPRVNNGEGLPVLFPDSDEGIGEDEILVTEILKKAGYQTALIGKWHLGYQPEFLPPNHGFDYFLGIPYPNDHGPERIWNMGTRNFPPIPLIENLETIKACDNNDLAQLPALFQRSACRKITEFASTDKPFYIQYSNIETHTPWFVPKGFEGKSMAGPYGDAVEYLDGSVGAIIRTVKRLGIEKNTLIIFTSDNGPLIVPYPELEACYGKYAAVDTSRHHILRGGKYQSRHDGGTRVPCIMVWPEVIPENSVCNTIIAGFDLYTTMCYLAGKAVPNDRPVDGENILPLIIDESNEPVHEAFFGYEARGLLMSVRYGKWKLAVPSKATYGIGQLDQPLLFNLDEDISERKDLSDDFPKIVENLLLMGEESKKAIIENREIVISDKILIDEK
nr:sulfatase-like hydrolase/transferase [Bacteroidota bacterium]